MLTYANCESKKKRTRRDNMSGGSLDYFFATLADHAGDFDDKELDGLVSDLSELFRAREWFLSADTSEGSWNEARDKFKAKWFTDYGRRERIEKYLAEIREEVMRSFGFGKYCRDCKHWMPNLDSKDYGRCEFETCCDNHRCESCEKWEANEE